MISYRLAHTEVQFLQGDIVTETTDAIANAANSTLLGGGGVDGAIHQAAGPELLQACQQLKQTLPAGRLPTGEAVITPGFQLPARFVIHCVGPRYAESSVEAPILLASCYTKALHIASAQNLTSVSFPSISTGIYGYPVEPAATVAVRAVREALPECPTITLVRFVLFDKNTYQAYVRASKDLVGNLPF